MSNVMLLKEAMLSVPIFIALFRVDNTDRRTVTRSVVRPPPTVALTATASSQEWTNTWSRRTSCEESVRCKEEWKNRRGKT